jgi:hypothetical protein
MLFFKVPITPELLNLSPAYLTIYIHLCYLNFKFTGTGRTDHFWITDRSLSALTHRSRSVIYSCKKYLKEMRMIETWIGEGNTTNYRLPKER